MIQNTDYSFVIASRLKELRDSKGLSFDRLSKELKEKYGVSISSDSLMNYEVVDCHHTKAKKNLGMRIEYLRCLADFYGVSSDYLLGISDIKSPDQTIQKIVHITGLTEDTILSLVALNEQAQHSLSVWHSSLLGEEIDDEQADNTPFSDLQKPVAKRDLVEILINSVLTNQTIQNDFVSIHYSFDTLFTIIDAYFSKKGEDITPYANYETRTIPRSDYVRFKAHEISKEIEQAIISFANSPDSNRDFDVI